MELKNILTTNNDERLLSYGDLSKRWQIPMQTLRIWVMSGKLERVKLGRHVRFDPVYIRSLERDGLK